MEAALGHLREVDAANRAGDAAASGVAMAALLGLLGPLFFGGRERAVAALRDALESKRGAEALGDLYAEAMDLLAGYPTAGREPVYTLALLASSYGLRDDHNVVRLERLGALEAALARRLGVAAGQVSILPLLIDPERDELYLTHFHRCEASVNLQRAGIAVTDNGPPVPLRQQKADGRVVMVLVSLRPPPRTDGGMVTLDSLGDAILPWLEAHQHLYPVPYFIGSERFEFWVRPISVGGPFTAPRMASYSVEREQLQAQITQAKARLGGSLAGVRAYVEAVYDPTIHAAPALDGLRLALWSPMAEAMVGACAFDLVPSAPLLSNRLLGVLGAAGITEVVASGAPVPLVNCADCGKPLFWAPKGRMHEAGGAPHTLH